MTFLYFIFPIALAFSNDSPVLQAVNELYQTGNHEYVNGNYSQAVEQYQGILERGFDHEDVYLNLGNSYLKMNEFGESIWAFERGLLLRPGEQDLMQNLEIAYSLAQNTGTISRSSPIGEYYSSVISLFPPFRWLNLGGILCFSIGLVSFVKIFFNNRTLTWARRVLLFMLAITIFVGLDVSNIFEMDMYGIITVDAIQVNTSTEMDESFDGSLSEGMKVKIVGEEQEWFEILLQDGRKGWIPASSMWKL